MVYCPKQDAKLVIRNVDHFSSEEGRPFVIRPTAGLHHYRQQETTAATAKEHAAQTTYSEASRLASVYRLLYRLVAVQFIMRSHCLATASVLLSITVYLGEWGVIAC